jgi:lipoprotein-anchoring transpeptidase ErfK/SrfK
MRKISIGFSPVYFAILLTLVTVIMSGCRSAASTNQNNSITILKTPVATKKVIGLASTPTPVSISTKTVNVSWMTPATMYTMAWADIVTSPYGDGERLAVDPPSTAVTVYGTTTGISVSGNRTWFRVSDQDSSPRYIAAAQLSEAVPILSVTESVPPAPIGTGKVMFVDLVTQRLYAYEDSILIKEFAITSGRPTLTTPVGTFTVLDKKVNQTFYSPWPEGDPNYYPPVFVPYALKLTDTGIYIIAAPWREAYNDFGPGSQYPHTLPNGAETTGSHGCIATSTTDGAWYYNWTLIGMSVVISD